MIKRMSPFIHRRKIFEILYIQCNRRNVWAGQACCLWRPDFC